MMLDTGPDSYRDWLLDIRYWILKVAGCAFFLFLFLNIGRSQPFTDESPPTKYKKRGDHYCLLNSQSGMTSALYFIYSNR